MWIKWRHYLVLVDYMSKFPIMRQVDNETSSMVMHSIKCVLSELGNIKEMISDNGPCFRSFEFANFVISYGILHTAISQHHHQSNDQVERCMRMIKGLIKKNLDDPWMSLLIWRLTPVDGDLRSPVELLNGCKYQSNLPLIRKTSTQTSSNKETLVVKIKDYHDGNAKELKPLYKGRMFYMNWILITVKLNGVKVFYLIGMTGAIQYRLKLVES